MKKIFFLSGVAMCALTLATSCVKDNESPSVVEIRSAKSEQLKAAAELARAQAAAATLAAQADANLKNAQAEVQKAQAEIAKAQAEYSQLQNALLEAEMDAEKAEIAARIAQAEANEAAAQRNLQNTLNQIEKDKAQFEYDMAKLVADLEKQKAEDAIRELNLAATNYSLAVADLVSAQSNLNTQKTNLARLEVNQANWEETKAQEIANYKHRIAQNQAQIEVYKQYANYTEDIEALRNKYDALCWKSDKLYDDYNVAVDNFNKANSQVKNENYEAANKKLEENPFWQVFLNWSDITLSDGETEVSFWNTKAGSWVFRSTNWESKNVIYYSYTDKEGNVREPNDVSFFVMSSTAAVSIDGIYGKIEEVSADVINMQIKEDKAAYAAEKKALDEALKALNDELKPLKEASAAKLTALNAIEVGAEGYEAAKTAYETAVLAVNAKQAEIDARTADIKTAAEKSEAYDIIADFVVNYAENCKTVADLYDAVGEGIASDLKDYGDAYVAKEKAWEEYLAFQPEINAISAVLYGENAEGAYYLDQWIKECENSIKYYQAMIDNYDLNNSSYEQTIETFKKNIALQEEYIKSLEVIANQRKAEYDAVLAKYQN